MTDRAEILGMGWVDAASMGRPGQVTRFESPEEMDRISGKSVLAVPPKSFGRMDRFSKLGFSAIAFAMADAGICPADAGDRSVRRNIALLGESATGCLETDLAYQATLTRHATPMPSPALFAYTLPSSFLGEASICYGLTGEACMIETRESTGVTALSHAMDCLGPGGCEAAVCGICNAGPDAGAFFMVLAPGGSGTLSGDGIRSRGTLTRTTAAGDRFFLGEREITGLTTIMAGFAPNQTDGPAEKEDR